MKQVYRKPESELVLFNPVDVLTDSNEETTTASSGGGIADSNNNGGSV